MSAPFRIEPHTRTSSRQAATRDAAAAAPAESDQTKEYFARLIKLVPGEIVGLYIAGKGIIPASDTTIQFVWIGIGLILVFLVRYWGTRDPANNKGPQWTAIGIAVGSFFLWTYTLGGPYETQGLYVGYIGTLAVLVWTFIIPARYQGDQ